MLLVIRWEIQWVFELVRLIRNITTRIVNLFESRYSWDEGRSYWITSNPRCLSLHKTTRYVIHDFLVAAFRPDLINWSILMLELTTNTIRADLIFVVNITFIVLKVLHYLERYLLFDPMSDVALSFNSCFPCANWHFLP